MTKQNQTKPKNKKHAFSFNKMFLSILVFSLPMMINAQSKLITGKVTDAQNMSIPGVSVLVKGTKIGTTTDMDGVYKIQANDNNQLVFSFIGFNTKTIAVNTKTTINVSLETSTTSLEEIVVVGYGTVNKKDVSGAVSKLDVEDLQKAPIRSFDEALAGRVAGVQVNSADGQPGSGINIVIRGNNSVTQANTPLYVIDGFLIENPDNNAINPQDIESLYILKDASATAIYGARGANGVIVITTKSGKKGAAVFSIDASYGFQENLKKTEVMSPYEFVKFQIELDPALTSGSGYRTPTEIYLSDGKTLEDYRNVPAKDWEEKITRIAPMQNYNFSARGGNANTKYSFSGSYTGQDGIIINSNYTRYQGRLKIDQTITKNLKMGFNTNYSHLEQSGISPSQSQFSNATNIMYSVWGYKPLDVPGTNLDEELLDPDVNASNDYRTNPYINLSNLHRLKTTKNLNTIAYLEYNILPELKLRVTSGVNETKIEREVYNNSNTQYGRPGSINGLNGSIDYDQRSNWLNENTLTWNKKFNKNVLNVLSGFTLQKETSKSYGVSANQIPAEYESLGLDGLQYGTQLRVDTLESVWTMASFLSRVNYTHNYKYIFTASMRADGSSRFPSENHWGYFPSGAIAWKFSNEKFLKNSKILSEGKLRSSYGQTGNNRVGNFDYLTRYFNPIQSNYVFNNQYIGNVVATNLGNSKLKWETTEQFDVGLDLGFLKQRITFSADIYRKTTKDLLLRASLPQSSGFATAIKNIGSMQNQGLELTLNTVNIKTKDFTWNSSFNISFNESKVLALSDNQSELISNINWDSTWQNTPTYIAKIGEPLGLMYGFISEGTYKYADFDQDINGKYILKSTITANGNTRANIQPGDIKYKDLNGDLNVTAADYTVIGHGLPKHIGGFTNNFTYKGFDLNVFFQWSYGNDLLNANRIVFEGMGGNNRSYLNQHASYVNRWSAENPDSNIYRTRGYFGGGYASQFVEDGSYIRLKTLSLGYKINPEFLKKVKLKSVRLYIAAQNLYTWTNYSGSDPEVNTYDSALTSGFDYSAYPRAKTITFGTNITF